MQPVHSLLFLRIKRDSNYSDIFWHILLLMKKAKLPKTSQTIEKKTLLGPHAWEKSLIKCVHTSPSYLTCSISWCRGEWIKAAAAAACVDWRDFLHTRTSWKSIRVDRAHKLGNSAIQSSPLSQMNRAGGPPLWSDDDPILCFQGGRVERRWWAGNLSIREFNAGMTSLATSCCSHFYMAGRAY